MAQPDAYIRISTLNDTTQAQRSTEQLGDTLRDALDPDSAEAITEAIGALAAALRGIDTDGVDGVRDGLDGVGNSAITAGDLIKANLISDVVMSGLKQVGAAIKNIAVDSVNTAMSNETAFAKASTLLTGDLEQFRSGLEEISNRTGVTFSDLAESMYSALSANVAQDKVLEFVENSVNLAKGGFTETATAIDVVTTALNAYHMEMGNATHVQDVLITTQNKGKTTVGELAGSMGKIIPTAQSVNIEFDQLGAMFATVTSNGVATAEATTYLNGMINELGASGSTAEKAMMAATEGTALAGKKFSEISAMGYDVTDVLKLMSDEAAKSGQSLADMFSSSEASKAANILLSNIDGFKQNIEAMADSTGAAASAADTMMDTTAEKVQVAKNQIDNLTASVAQSLLPVIGEAAEEVSKAVSAGDVSEISEKLGSFISGALSLLLKNIKLIASSLAGVTASVVTYKSLMAGANFITDFNRSAKALVSTFHGLKTATDSATAAQEANNIAASANPYMAVITVISVLIGVFVTLAGNISSCNEKMKELQESSEELMTSAEDYKKKSESLEEVKKRYEDVAESADNTAQKTENLKSLQDELISQYPDLAGQIDLVTGSYEEQAAALDRLITANDDLSRAQAEAALKDALAAENEKTSIGHRIVTVFDDWGTQSGQVHDLIWDFMSTNLKTFDPVANDAGFDYKFSGTYEERERDFERLYNYLKDMGWEMTEFGRDVLEQWENMRAAKDDLTDKQKRYNELYGITEDDYNYYNQGSAIAVEEERKGKEREQRLKEERELAEKEKSANAELYNQFRADAKYSYDMGVIDAGEYYSQLAALRDSYLEEDTDEWRSVNVELKKYYDSLSEDQKKAYEQQLKQQKEAAEQAQRERLASYNEEKSQLQFRHKTGQISEKQYYEELAKIRDKYLDKNSSEWRNSFLETYQYNQKIIEANKDALNALLTETSDSTLSALQNIISARDSLTSKLVDFNKTFEKITETVPETIAVKGEFTVTTAEHEVETYKMGADSIEDNIKILEEYGEMLDALKARGADDGTLNDILAMDVDEAMKFGSQMLKMSDREWNGYFDSMARLRETAADISAKYYQSEVDNLKNNFVDRLREELFGLEGDMLSIGAEAALSFIEGWNKELGANDLTLGDMLYSLAGGSYTTAPKMSQLLSGFGATIGSSEKEKTAGGTTVMPIYIGGEKLTDIVIEGINSKNIKVGKNVLNT